MIKHIKTVTGFMAWVKKLPGHSMLYRGLADNNWPVEASGYRRIKNQEGDSPSSVFRNSIDRLLDNAGLQGFRERQGKKLLDLELLAELQHNGAATCLIDFTADPLVALWFACQRNSEKNGKVIAMRTDNVEDFAEIEYKSLNKPIREFLEDRKLWKWSPRHQNNRIVAQNSVFVFGKGEIEERYYEDIEIKKSNKKFIIKELHDKFGINENYLFSDFAGFSRANAHDKSYSDYDAEDYFSLGVDAHQRQEFERAIKYYSAVIELNSDNVGAHYNRGLAKDKIDNHKGAIEDYDKALALNPNDISMYIYNSRGVEKGKLGDYKGAIKDFDKAIKLNSNYADAYNNRGLARDKIDDHEGAIEDYDKAIELNPNEAIVHYNRGIAKGKLGNYKDAIEDYNKAIELNPNYADAYYNRGFAKDKLGNHKGAIDDFNKAIELNPDYADTYNNRGVARGKLGNYKGAIDDFDKAIELNPNYASAYYNRGNARDKLDDHKGAIEDFNKAIELNPNYAEAYNNRGVAKGKLGDYKGAIDDFDKAIELNPNYADAYYNRGLAKDKLGDHKGAEEDFAKAAELMNVNTPDNASET